MAAPQIEVWLTDPLGVRLALLDKFQSLSYSRVRNAPGSLAMILEQSAIDRRLLRLDGRIEVWRSVTPGRWYLDTNTVWLIRKPKGRPTTSELGKRQLTITAVSAMQLLKRRIVAYDASTSYTSKTTYADDMLKAIWDENFTASALSSDRDGYSASDSTPDISAYVSRQANQSLAPSITKAFARRNVLAVFQDIAQQSDTNGTPLFFDIHVEIANGATTMQLRTWINQRGLDRRYPSGANPVLLSAANGTLSSPSREDDRTDEVNFVVAGGQGNGSSRNIQTASDATRIKDSPFNRCEAMASAIQATTDAGVQAEADAALVAGKPISSFGGTLLNTDFLQRGKHWDLGDRLTAEYDDGERVDYHVHAINVTANENGFDESAELRL